MNDRNNNFFHYVKMFPQNLISAKKGGLSPAGSAEILATAFLTFLDPLTKDSWTCVGVNVYI
jgi:hypothetical protein